MSSSISTHHGQDLILSVSQLNQKVKTIIEQGFPSICVQGEISNFKKQSSVHLYFSLKDAKSQLSSLMFRGKAAQLQQVPKEGDQVILKGDLSVYTPRGQYQLLVHSLQFVGTGQLLLQLEKLKQEILNMGWFSKKHKKPLPSFPNRIAVITSPTGSVIQDILNVLKQTNLSHTVILYPVKVQGIDAPGEIMQAITDINCYQLADVIIIGRGGGSIEDLWAFNDKQVAEAIFNSQIPTLGAVGHETDHTIAEYVADERAPTPSAAAQRVLSHPLQYVNKLSPLSKQLSHLLKNKLSTYRSKLQTLIKHPCLHSSNFLLGEKWQSLDYLKENIDRSQQTYIKDKCLQIKVLRSQLSLLHPHIKLSSYAKDLITIKNQCDSSFVVEKQGES